MSVHELFNVEPGEEWPATEPWVAAGLLGEQYFDILEQSGYSAEEASKLAIDTARMEDPQLSRIRIRELAKQKGFFLGNNT